MKRFIAVVLLTLVTASFAVAGDREYKAVVRAVEKHYRVRGEGLPWVARIALRLSRPMHGVEVKLAEFPDLPSRLGPMQQFEEVITKAVGPGWTPMVRVYSRRSGEYTFLFTKYEKDKLVMLIAAVERGEAAVVQVKLKPEKLDRWIDDPVRLARNNPGSGSGRNRDVEIAKVASPAAAATELAGTSGVPVEELRDARYDSPIGRWKVGAEK